MSKTLDSKKIVTKIIKLDKNTRSTKGEQKIHFL